MKEWYWIIQFIPNVQNRQILKTETENRVWSSGARMRGRGSKRGEVTADGPGAPFGGNENVLEATVTVFARSENTLGSVEMFS